MKYIKTTLIYAFAAVLAITVLISPVSAQTIPGTQDNGSTVTAPATQDNGATGGTLVTTPGRIDTQDNGTTGGNGGTLTTQDNGTTGGNGGTLTTQDNGTTGGVTTIPSTQDNGATGGILVQTPGRIDTQDNGTTGATIPAPVAPPASGGGSTSSGGGSSTSSGGGSVSSGSFGVAVVTNLPVLTNVSQCNYLTSFLKIGKANPVEQVTRLQSFLKNTEGLNVDITGTFDQKTFDAVSTFQAKYRPDVLAPWGIRNSTGQVYFTTRKKINEVYCKTSFSLTPAQTAEIEAYRTARANGLTPVSGDVGTNINGDTTSPAPSSLVSATSTDDTQVASVGRTSLARKVWDFIKKIFGRDEVKK